MSLEQALQENTQALNRLSALLEANKPVEFHIQNNTDVVKEIIDAGSKDVAKEIIDSKVDEAATDIAKEIIDDAVKQAEAVTHNYDDVKVALMSVAKVSRAKLQTILDEFGVANISAIDPSDYSRVIELAEKALETADA